MNIDDLIEDTTADALQDLPAEQPVDPSGRPIERLVRVDGRSWYQQADGNWYEYAPGKPMRAVANAATVLKIENALALPPAQQRGQVMDFPGSTSGATAPRGSRVEIPRQFMGTTPPSPSELQDFIQRNPGVEEDLMRAPWYKQFWATGGSKIQATSSLLPKMARLTGKAFTGMTSAGAYIVMAAGAYMIAQSTWQQIRAIPADDPDRKQKIEALIVEAVTLIGLPLLAVWLGGLIGGLIGSAVKAPAGGAYIGRNLAAFGWLLMPKDMPVDQYAKRIANLVVGFMPAGDPVVAPTTKPETKPDEEPETKPDTKPKPKVQPWLPSPMPKAEPKAEPKVEPKTAPKAEPKAEPKAAAKAASAGAATPKQPWLPQRRMPIPVIPPAVAANRDQQQAPPAPPRTGGGPVETPYVVIGPNMNYADEFYKAQERMFGKKLWEDDDSPDAKRTAYVQQLIESGKAAELIKAHGVDAVIAGVEKLFTGTPSTQLEEDWKNELLAIGLSAAAAGVDALAARGGGDVRNIDGQEVTHFTGSQGQLVQPIKIDKKVTIDGKPATVWQGKNIKQRGLVKWYWNYDDEPVMKNLMDEDMLIPKDEVKARKAHDAEDDTPDIGDLIIMELGDGRAIQARIAEVKGNSMVLDLDETAQQWLDDSPVHDDLMIGGDSHSKIAHAWNRMVSKLPADTPAGWAAVFASEESRTGQASRSMPRKWARIWRQQHEALGDSLTRADSLAWADDVEAVLDGTRMDEAVEKTGASLRKWLDPKDAAMLAVWMAARAGAKGKSIKSFAQQTARTAGHPEDTYWDKIKRIVSESKHGRRALMRLYDIEPVTAVDDDFVIASDVHEYDDNRKLTWNLYKKVVPTQDKMEPAYYHVAHLDLSPYGDFTKDQLMAAARDAMKNADVMVDEDDSEHGIIPQVSVKDVLQQVFNSDTDVTLQDKPHGYTAYVLINRPLDGNEELATEQALFRAGYDVDRVECKDNGVGGIKTNIYLKSKPESDVSEARPDVLGMAESAGDHQSVEKRYYIVRKGKPPAATPGIQGFHSVSAAEDKLNSMSDPDGYNIVAIDSPKKDVRTEDQQARTKAIPAFEIIKQGTWDILVSKEPVKTAQTGMSPKYIAKAVNTRGIGTRRGSVKMGYAMTQHGAIDAVQDQIFDLSRASTDPNDYHGFIVDFNVDFTNAFIDKRQGNYFKIDKDATGQPVIIRASLDYFKAFGAEMEDLGFRVVRNRQMLDNASQLFGFPISLSKVKDLGLVPNMRYVTDYVHDDADGNAVFRLIPHSRYTGINKLRMREPGLIIAASPKDPTMVPPAVSTSTIGMAEAKYQGREVQLGKPIRTNTSSGGKFKVYVRDPKTGNIKMVRFGDTTGLTIKRDDPKRRKNFRARHHCDNPGPRTKARYWSCRMWTAKPVGKILKGK